MRWLDNYINDPRIWTHDRRPDYGREFARRVKLLNILRSDKQKRASILTHYRNSPVDFILDWATTYDPRNAAKGLPTTMPFCMFPRQIDYLQFLHECVRDDEGGLVEKCRDMGASYVTLAYAVWSWLFVPGVAIGVGSRKEILVDRIGDPDSLLEKVRMMVDLLPHDIFWPKGFKPKDHMPNLKIINPATGAIISGEAGDNIGRGGRKKWYLKDEAAHYERPELIEASLGDNTNVPLDISSVNGPGNVFHRRRMAGEIWEPGKRMTPGKTRVFIMDWRDHPAKDQEWYDRRRQRAEDEGLLHKFAQEVDRDYNSAVEGVLIPSAWVQAAINAHERLDYWEPSGMWVAGQDVADSGGDVNALVIAQGSVVRYTEKDGREVDQAIPHLMLTATLWGVKIYQYEVTGVGTAPKVAARMYDRFEAIPWSPSGAVVNPNADDIAGTQPGEPDRMCNRDYFQNANAQAAWNLRLRFQRTYKAVVMGERQDPDEMISIPADDYELIQELSQPTYSSTPKITIDKKPNGAKSPNKFDALKICFAPRQRRVEALEYGVETSMAVAVNGGLPELMF